MDKTTQPIPMQIRLTAQDRADIERVRRHLGYPSAAAVLRHGVQKLLAGIEAESAGKSPKKSRKSAD